MSSALRRILRDQQSMRVEEESEDGWFALPLVDDADVNWMDFEVDICGPENYVTNPKADEEGERPSPYADGLFKLRVTLENSYPQTAPKVRFITKCWHPNISYEDGKMCADFLTDSWSPTMCLRDVLQAVRTLLASPNGSENVNQDAARELTSSVEEFERHVQEDVAKYASG